ncbi:MAG: crotonobetainyl-CoA:carnitine CoA-transferase CaiB-like acyl-CoA transferase [Acidimicrobiales bacterium]|jgi:crotonobetainyl-CoA:carnitine CoA-transferase CaiB-like acyl-CoA transferase
MTETSAMLLQGVRVVEIAHPLTEHAGRLFAGLGAEVLLIEPPGGASTRHRLPNVPGADESDRASIPFLARNANKHSIVVDPTNGRDSDVLAGLVARSHLVLDADSSPYNHVLANIEGIASRITVIDEVGLGTASIVGFAASGGMSCSGWPDQPPANAPSWIAADGASIYAAMMGAVALFVANRHGVRLDYDVPFHEAAMRAIAPWSRHLHSAGVNVAGQGVNPGRCGFGPYPVFETVDGHIKIVIATPRQLDGLLELMGQPSELTEGVWADTIFRRENVDAFYMMCGEYLSDRTTDELFHQGQKLGLTITPLNTMRQFVEDPHAQARGLFLNVDDPEFGPLEMMRSPLLAEPADRMAGFIPAPALGSANDRAVQILTEPIAALIPTGFDVDPLLPLADLRLLQLGSGAVVPEACSDFALLGCDVVRVESMVNPDFLRRGGLDGMDSSSTFNQLNMGVRSLTIDMRADEATELIGSLLPTCDAVVENMRAPVVENWGFDYDACRLIQDDVVSLSSQGFGRGPYGHYQSFGPNLSAYSGAASQWAHPSDEVAVGTTVPHPDHVAGKQAYVALLAALRYRDRGGGGCSIEAAQVEAPAHLIADRFLAQQFVDADLAPLGNRSLDIGPHGCYPCQEDEWIALATETDEQWHSLAALIDQPWTLEPQFATNAGRVAAAADLDVKLAEWTTPGTIDEVEASLRSVCVPASRVVNADHMAVGAGNEPDGIFAQVDHPVAGRHAVAGLPVLTTDGRRPVALRSPCMGEHTDEIVAELAGYSRVQIADLRRQNILGY